MSMPVSKESSQDQLRSRGGFKDEKLRRRYGCALHELRSGTTPFHAAAPRELFRRILQEPPPAVGGDDLRDLLAALLAKKPADRATSAAVARHPFFAPIDWRAAAARNLPPPHAPDLPPFLAVRDDGELRFADDKPSETRAARLATPRRVTFDEENDDASLRTTTVAKQRAAKRTFSGFALDANVDLAASPATYRASARDA